jgi:hypothetical protein
MKHAAGGAVLAAVLAGCGAGFAEGPEDSCGAVPFQILIGQPGAVAEALEFDRPKRVIPEGSAVTMDFLPERINFDLDAADRIARIYCG